MRKRLRILFIKNFELPLRTCWSLISTKLKVEVTAELESNYARYMEECWKSSGLPKESLDDEFRILGEYRRWRMDFASEITE